MAKTIILGNNPQKGWIKGIEGIQLIPVPNIPSNRNFTLAEYVDTLPKDIDCLIIDADSLDAENIELPLAVALYVRLMLHSCLKTSLSQIYILTDLDVDTYKGYGVLSMLLMTQKVDIVNVNEVQDIQDILDIASPLLPSEYVEGFIDLIKIEPKEKVEGRHSIANEWGAYILAQSISAGQQNVAIRPSGTSEYFLYSSIVSLNAIDVSRIINGESSWIFESKIQVKEQFTYLLIDDEAEKGWTETLKLLLPNANGTVWDKKALDYNGIEDEIRNDIEQCKFDVIFLDLRMNGVDEEKNTNPVDFSGMKILHAIKQVNPGIQVIMLTATNKGWNVKSMLEAGADGYYMKESPEYHFPLSYTEQNTRALKKEIEKCLERAYLKEIFRRIKRIDLNVDNGLGKTIESQLAISFDLVRRANSYSDFAFAYIALEQVFEIAANHFYHEEFTGDEWRCFFVNERKGRIEYNRSSLRRKFNITFKSMSATPMWVKVAAMYYGLFNGTYEKFADDVKEDIKLRNDYIHENIKPKITSDDYRYLFDSVMEFISVLE